MHRNPATIPGNIYAGMRIWPDTTKAALEDRLQKLIRNQRASMRNSLPFNAECRKLRRAIKERSA